MNNLENKPETLPLFLNSVFAGFPAPAESDLDKNLNLHNYLIQNPASTFFVRVTGESMTGAGIHPGDLLIVDRSLEPENNKIVLAILQGEFTVKRLIKKNGVVFLMPENEKFPPIEIKDGMDFEVWGVVIHAIRSF